MNTEEKSIPIELWQYIFESGLVGQNSGGEYYLQTLCSVCKGWRAAAISHCSLWARLPSIDCAHSTLHSTPSAAQKEEILTRRYLRRSGQVPLTFDFSVYLARWNDPVARERYQKLLQLLIDQCHRWEEVDIWLPIDAFNEVLPCIQGNLPMLKKLELGGYSSSSAYSSSGASTYRIGCFREAPLLREVFVSTLDASGHTPGPVLTIDLPWSQLRKFKTMSGTDTLCKDLIEARPSDLRSMEFWYRSQSPPPPTKNPVTLPELENFQLNINERSLSLTSLFDILTLPALSRLVIRGRSNVASANSIYGQVLNLVQRSKCSLKRFHCSAPIESSQDTLITILRLSPNLRELAVSHINSTGLRLLALKSRSLDDPANLVPNLNKMRLCHRIRVGGLVDTVALAEMVISRTKQFYDLDASQPPFEPLAKIELENYDVESLEIQWEQAISKIAGNSERFNKNTKANNDTGDSLEDIASNMEGALRDKFNRYWLRHLANRDRDRMDTDLHRELDQEMCTMENLDLERYQDVAVLARRDIPNLLSSVEQMLPGAIPGDDLFEFRSRAKKLLDKWKPIILRDALASPYTWRFQENKRARLICHPIRSFDEIANQETAAKLWEDLIAF